MDRAMTQGQFKAYIRLIIDDLKEVLEMESEDKKTEKLQKTIDNLQSSLEDWKVRVHRKGGSCHRPNCKNSITQILK